MNSTKTFTPTATNNGATQLAIKIATQSDAKCLHFKASLRRSFENMGINILTTDPTSAQVETACYHWLNSLSATTTK